MLQDRSTEQGLPAVSEGGTKRVTAHTLQNGGQRPE